MLGALAALLPAGAAAQQSDARQRTTETISPQPMPRFSTR